MHPFPTRSTVTAMALALAVFDASACTRQQPAQTPPAAVARATTTPAPAQRAPEPTPLPRKPKVDQSDFAQLTLWLARALAARDEAALGEEGFVLSAEPCFPARWLADPAEQSQLILDWVLVESSLAAPNPVEPNVALNAYVNYSAFVFPDGRIRYFMGDWRGSNGPQPSVSRWPGGVQMQTRRFLAAGFEEQCRDADALERGDIDLEPEQTRQLLFPFIVDRVPLRPLCGALTHSSPPMPREGWELQQLGMIALSNGKSGPFAVGAFVTPEKERTRVVAFDPLAHTQPDFQARRECEGGKER